MTWYDIRALQAVVSVVLLYGSVGCFGPNVVQEERLHRALALVDQGSASLREGKVDDAAKFFTVAAELAPLAAAVDGQGCVALVRGDFEKAERLFTEAYEMDGTYDEALANLALLMDLSGKPIQAKDLYNQVVSRLPEHLAARNNRAALEYDLGADKMDVLKELEKAGVIAQHEVIAENIARLKQK